MAGQPHPSVAAIRTHIASFVARELNVDPDGVDTSEPFERYGLGSVQAVVLAGELEEWLGLTLPPTLAYDYPNIDALSRYLGAETASPSPPAYPAEANANPIAIIGIGCRFPSANGPREFWRLLSEGVDAISEIPDDRWSAQDFFDPDPATVGTMTTRWGGFLSHIDRFDCSFFGISPREARRMDPQQRLLLEVTWEAFEDAGLVKEDVAGTPFGVFVGASTNDYGCLQMSDTTMIDAYAGTGSALSILANRLSYVFDLRGPSICVDTACSSSLVAVHLACESLRRGESRLALAAGVNAILAPSISINFSKAGVLAADGRCKAFDHRADGYARAEGCGVVILKPLRLAVADHDPIYAVIRGSAINQDGRTNGIMAPSRSAQEEVLRTAYARAGVDPQSVQYVEAHGSGTLLGDPIEATALGRVLGHGRAPDRACRIGSVKTNIGHLEAAAGVAGLIKAALAIQHRLLPPSLHFQRPNPHIRFAELGLRVQERSTAWPNETAPMIAGASSFGFGGTNAHVVLAQAPADSTRAESLDADNDATFLLPLSAHTGPALRDVARSHLDMLRGGSDFSVRDLCYTLSSRRAHHAHRLAVIAADRDGAAKQLESFVDSKASLGWTAGCRRLHDAQRRLVFVFPGQGPEWVGMGRQLMLCEPAFRAEVERCDSAIRHYLDASVLDELDGQTNRAGIDVVQPTLFALQVSLAALWRSWGVEPDAVLGQSMGEVAAAHVAGALDLDSAARVICARSRLMKSASGRGGMLLVGVSPTEAHQHLLEGLDKLVSVAVHSGPHTTVLSGDLSAIEAIESRCVALTLFHRRLSVEVAAHSPHMDTARAKLCETLTMLAPLPPRVPFFSTVVGGQVGETRLDGEYWARNLREPVLLGPTVAVLLADGYRTFLELSPHPTLASVFGQCLDDTTSDASLLPSMHRDAVDPLAPMMQSLGALFVSGLADPKRFGPSSGRVLSCPRYPWQHEPLWFDDSHSASPRRTGGREQPRHGLPEGSAEWLYHLQWDKAAPPTAQRPDASNWLLLSDNCGVGANLADTLREAGHRVTVALAGTTFREHRDRFHVRPGLRDDIRRLLGAVPDIKQLRVVHLWSLDAEYPDSLTARQIEEATSQGCVALLHWLQELTKLADRVDSQVFVVTRGAQALSEGAPCPGLAAAPLWGFGRAAQQEVPQLWGALLDLDPLANAASAARCVLAECSKSDGESQVAYRDGARYVARLRRAALDRPALVQAAQTLRKDASYLITGGRGGLGLQIARRLVEQGAARLILLGRTALPDRTLWSQVTPGTAEAEQIAAIRAIENLGASVHIGCVDVSREDQLASFLDNYRNEGWPPIRGVVHAAGTVELTTLLELDDDMLIETLRPKVLGGWLLHRHLAQDPIEFFVSFSSAASLLGSPRLAHYAAGNGFLDALAHHRRSMGSPALTVGWGLWGDSGSAARFVQGGHTLLRGADAMSVPDGLAVLEHLMGHDVVHIGVLRVDWSEWARRYPSFSDAPLLRDLVGLVAHTPDARDDFSAEAVALLLQLAPEERRRTLEAQLGQILAGVLRLPAGQVDVDAPLSQLGVDSLMAVELRNRIRERLNVAVPIVWFLGGIGIGELATQISGILATQPPSPGDGHHDGRSPIGGDAVDVPGPSMMTGVHAKELLDRLHELSDHEVEALLKDLQTGG